MTADRTRQADYRDLADRVTPEADDLQRRLEHLPPGHPSSPFEADSTRHEDRRASSDEIRPLTDAEWADHLTDVRSRLEKAQDDGLATNRQFTIDGKGQIWTDDRAALHDMIINDLLAESSGVPCDHRAIIAGGLGGAGKTTVLGSHAGIDLSQYLTINPDNIKGELVKRGLVPDVDGLTPMEASGLAHEEASHIAKQLALRAQAEGRNVIWDITMSDRRSVERRIDELEASGYDQVEGLFVDIPIEVSIERADARHRHDHEIYRAGDGLGGRLVPEEVTRAQADSVWGSHNRRTFEEVKHRFDGWSLYDNSVTHRDPLLMATSATQDSQHEETSR